MCLTEAALPEHVGAAANSSDTEVFPQCKCECHTIPQLQLRVTFGLSRRDFDLLVR